MTHPIRSDSDRTRVLPERWFRVHDNGRTYTTRGLVLIPGAVITPEDR